MATPSKCARTVAYPPSARGRVSCQLLQWELRVAIHGNSWSQGGARAVLSGCVPGGRDILAMPSCSRATDRSKPGALLPMFVVSPMRRRQVLRRRNSFTSSRLPTHNVCRTHVVRGTHLPRRLDRRHKSRVSESGQKATRQHIDEEGAQRHRQLRR
jgi:hypothetical protein